MAPTVQSVHVQAGSELDNRRIAAAAIDLAAPGLALVALFAGGLLTPAVALVLLGWTLYYFFALESGGGQTVGKRAMHLRVVSLDGTEPTMEQYAKRSIVRVVDLPVVGLVAMLVSGDRRQRIGDRVAGTLVVDANSTEVSPTIAMEPVAEPQPQPAVAPMARKRPGLGGPEIKLPSFRRKPKPAVVAASAPVAEAPAPIAEAPSPAAPKPAKRPRPSLGGPEIKLPSLRRKRKPAVVAAAAPVVEAPAPTAPKPAKRSRPTLGGPEIKLPSFGRKRKAAPAPQPVAPDPLPAAPEPEPLAAETPAVPEREPEPARTPAPFAFDETAPAPDIEVVRPQEDPEAAPEPEPDAQPGFDYAAESAPDVQVMSPEPEPEAPARQAPAIPAVPPVEPASPAPPAPQPAATQPSPPQPARPPIPAVEPQELTASEEAPEPATPEHSEAVHDDGSPRLKVKPIETVSPLDLLMEDAEGTDDPEPGSSV